MLPRMLSFHLLWERWTRSVLPGWHTGQGNRGAYRDNTVRRGQTRERMAPRCASFLCTTRPGTGVPCDGSPPLSTPPVFPLRLERVGVQLSYPCRVLDTTGIATLPTA